MCVCSCQRKGERKRGNVCVRENDEMWVCQREKDSEKVDEMCLWERNIVRNREWERVRNREWEREREREREKDEMCVCHREGKREGDFIHLLKLKMLFSEWALRITLSIKASLYLELKHSNTKWKYHKFGHFNSDFLLLAASFKCLLNFNLVYLNEASPHAIRLEWPYSLPIDLR